MGCWRSVVPGPVCRAPEAQRGAGIDLILDSGVTFQASHPPESPDATDHHAGRISETHGLPVGDTPARASHVGASSGPLGSYRKRTQQEGLPGPRPP